jgi:adenylate cyclase
VEAIRGDEADLVFFERMETHLPRLFRSVVRHLPSSPRCAMCAAPYAGLGGAVMRRAGFGPSRKNPSLCNTCFERAPMGGIEMEIGILFVDVRGFTSSSEGRAPTEVAALLNRFFAAATDVLLRHAIVDKLIGDQVMALYLPGVFSKEIEPDMAADALRLMRAVGYGPDTTPWIEIGVGLDVGTAFVGNVGEGEVKDFTAIGDVVNTAARLQAAAAGGEVVISEGLYARIGDAAPMATPRSLTLKGKAEPVPAMVVAPPA